MKENNNQKGITLIALIITIIVMLILVGVTVTVALNGGLFDTAKKAAKETQYEADYETLQAGIIGALNKDFMIPNEEALKKNLPTNWDVVKEENIYIVTSPNGNEYKVDENGIVNESIHSVGEWWELTEEEKKILIGDEVVIADGIEKSGVTIAIEREEGENGRLLGILILTGSSDGSFCLGSEVFVFSIENLFREEGVNNQKIWYRGEVEEPRENPKEYTVYTGECPFSFEDFPEDKIYCRSYLERIMASFNK